MAHRQSLNDLSYTVTITALAVLALVILLGPVVVVLITSFTTAASLKFPPPDLSWKWYEALLDPIRSRHIHTAASNSLYVATWAPALATVGAVLAA